MQAHGTAVVTADTGLAPLAQSEREAIAHLWALRIRVLMDISGCTVRMAIAAVADAAEQEQQQ